MVSGPYLMDFIDVAIQYGKVSTIKSDVVTDDYRVAGLGCARLICRYDSTLS